MQLKSHYPSKTIYIIGIEGAGTSALARLYVDLGYQVLGSDEGDHFYNDVLQEKNINVFSHYQAKNLPLKLDWIVYSTSIKKDNPEYQEAQKRKIKMLSYPEAVANLFNQKLGLAVCGTHGKTTTTAFLAHIFKTANKNPQALVGSKVLNWGSNSLTGKGEYFIFEADEYQNKLKYYNPYAVILTSLDWDHPDFYPNFDMYQQVFIDFINKVSLTGWVVYNNDDSNVIEVIKKSVLKNNLISYGFHSESDYQIINRKVIQSDEENKWGESFQVINSEKNWKADFKLNLIGRHNILNATSAIVLAVKLGINISVIQKALRDFQGTVRRFEYKGNYKRAIIIDDYAHHPEEIRATIKTAREIFPQKSIYVFFHPHSFSRTQALLDDFAQSLSLADKIYILDIYGSVREKEGEVSSNNIVSLINKYQKEKAYMVGNLTMAQKKLEEIASPSQVIITMGAGDVWKIVPQNRKGKFKNNFFKYVKKYYH